jgi:hypothetical protein
MSYYNHFHNIGLIMPSNFHTKFHPIISKSGMRLEVLIGNKISEKFVAGI